MEEKIKLTRYSKSAGCAAKLGPKILSEVVGKLPKFQDEKLLVGPLMMGLYTGFPKIWL